MNNTNRATITATLAVGATTGAPYYQINISQKLCCKACEDEIPVFNPAFSVVSISNVGTNQYVATIHVEGLISYTPCRSGNCNTKSMMLSQNFTLPIYSTTAIESIAITKGASVNRIASSPCNPCSRDFVSETPLTLTITTA